eukprot:SAG11_NODE_4155_length_2037_cov_0.977296_1_plen_141_part_10
MSPRRPAPFSDERALAGRQHTLGHFHPESISSMGNVANVLGDLGELRAARGERDYAHAWSLRYSVFFNRQVTPGFFIRAEMHEKAVALCRTHLGAEHRATLNCISNLANMLSDENEEASNALARRCACLLSWCQLVVALLY